MLLTVSDDDKFGQQSSVVDEAVYFYRSFSSPELRPRKNVQAKVYEGRIDGEKRVFEFKRMARPEISEPVQKFEVYFLEHLP